MLARFAFFLLLVAPLVAQTSYPATLAGATSGGVSMEISGLRVERTSTTQINIRARFVPLYDLTGAATTLIDTVNVTVDITASGAGGRASGTSQATDTCYAIMLISDGAGTDAGLIEDAAEFATEYEIGTPDLPGGYTYFRRVAFCFTNATGSGEWRSFHQNGHNAVVARLENFIQSGASQPDTATLDDCSAHVPPSIRQAVFNITTSTGTPQSIYYFSYDPDNTATAISAFGFKFAATDADHQIRIVDPVALLTTSQGFYWAMQGDATNTGLALLGWYDPL